MPGNAPQGIPMASVYLVHVHPMPLIFPKVAQVFSYLPPNKEKQRQADVLSMPLRGKVGISRYLSSLATLAKSVSPNKICSLIYSL